MKKYIFLLMMLLLFGNISKAQTPTNYDYWFDSNTSQKTYVTINGDLPTIDAIYSGLNISELNPGLHFLRVQFKDASNNNVGEELSKYFVIPWTQPWTNSGNYIAVYEYWFDGNFAARTSVSTTGNPQTISVQTDIDASGLNPGLHFFHIRFGDSEGKWSDVESNSFVIPWAQTPTFPTNVITECQYWIDMDFGNKVIVPVNNESTFNIERNIDYSNLNRGLHFFHICFKDSEGKWSCVQSNFFVIPDSLPWIKESNVLTDYEYWLDNNYADKKTGTTGNLKSITLADPIDYNTLNRGLHYFHIRFKDSEGKWSCVQSNYFIIPDKEQWTGMDNKIIAYKYWYDDGTGGFNNITLPTPISPYELNTGFTVPHFNEGTTHSFSIQFKDVYNQWSGVLTSSFTFTNSKPVASVTNQNVTMLLGETYVLNGSASDPNGDPITGYEWAVVSAPAGSTKNGTLGTETSLSFNPDVAGTYVLSFRATDDTEWSEPVNVTITVNSCPVTCGMVLTCNAKLTQDLDCSGTIGPAITIGADNITLDLNGHTITAGAGQSGIVITDKSNIIITSGQPGGKIYSETESIIIQGENSSNINISNINLSGSNSETKTGRGIVVMDFNKVNLLTIDGVVINNRLYGILLNSYGSTGPNANITIKNSNIDGNENGISIGRAESLSLISNRVKNNSSSAVTLGELSTTSIISGNDVSGSTVGLIIIGDMHGFEITNDMFSGFGSNSYAGIEIFTSSNLSIFGVDVSWTGSTTRTGYGIISPNWNLLNDISIDGVTSSNRDYGLFINSTSASSKSHNITVKNSNCTNNNTGLALGFLEDISISNNNLTENGWEFLLVI